MGFWGRLFGRTQFDTTVTDYVATVPAGPFRMAIADVFSITGRGTVVTGTVETGRVSVGDRIGLRRGDGSRVDVVVTGVEAFQKVMDAAGPGDHVGVLLAEISRDEVTPGSVLES